MRKLLLLFFALLTGVSGAWAVDYTGIKLTFSRADAGSGTATANVSDVTVNVTDQTGAAIDGVSATLESTSITELKTGSAAALGRTSNAVLAPNAGYANETGGTITYTFKVEGLSTDFTYDRAAIDVYALNASGASQDANVERPWNIDISTGSATDALTSLVSENGYNIVGTDVDDGIRHKVWSKAGTETASTETLYIKVTLTRGNTGCFAGISEVRLYGLGTHTWESKSGWTMASSGTAVVYSFGVHTPNGFESFKLNQIQISQLTGDNNNNDCYLAIATEAVTNSNTSLSCTNVVAISDNHLAPSSSTAKLETYNFTNTVCLAPNTTYYLVFLASNEQSNGNYTAQATRIALNHKDYGTYAYNVYPWSGNIQTNWWPYFTATLTDVDDTNVYITDLAPMNNGKAYVITNTRGSWQFSGASAANMGVTESGVDLSDANQQIVIIKQDDEYYLYSVAAGKYLTKTNQLYASPLDPVTITVSSVANGNYKWFFSFDSTHNINVATSPTNLVINDWYTNDAGNTCAIIEAASFDNTSALAAFTNYAQRVTDYANYNGYMTNFVHSCQNEVGYPSQSSDGYRNLAEILLKSSDVTVDDYNGLPACYSDYLTEQEINKPTDGKVYKFTNVQKNGTTKFYLYDNNGQLAIATEEPTDGSNEFVCHVTGEKFAFVSKKGNYFVGASHDTNGQQMTTSYDSEQQPCSITKFPSTSGSNLETTAELAFGKVFVKFDVRANKTSSYGTTLLVSSGHEWNAYTSAYLNSSYSNMYELTEVSDYYNKVKLTSDDTDAYASVYLPFAVTIPEGVKAFRVESQDGSKAVMQEIVGDAAGTLPANTGAILKKYSQTENSIIYLSPAEEAGSYDGENLLRGTAVAKTRASLGDGTTYVLGKIDDEIGLCEYTATDLAEGKAYLFIEATGGGEAKALTLYFGDETALDAVKEETADNAPVYDLSGRRVERATRGLYIQNGKKFVVK